MNIPTLSKEQAVGFLLAYNFDATILTMGLGSLIDANKDFQCMVCDYTKLNGYEISYTIAIYDRKGNLLRRFNVER